MLNFCVSHSMAFSCVQDLIKWADWNHFYKRCCLTKFRISSHKPKIETGRLTRPLTPLEQRVCDHCLMTIEDEFHFLMQCPRYSHIRSNFFSNVQK